MGGGGRRERAFCSIFEQICLNDTYPIPFIIFQTNNHLFILIFSIDALIVPEWFTLIC